VIDHIHGGGEQHSLIGLTGAPADDLRKKRFSGSGIADENGAGTFGDELQIEQTQDADLSSVRLLWCLK
jgi:hypothetical protein